MSAIIQTLVSLHAKLVELEASMKDLRFPEKPYTTRDLKSGEVNRPPDPPRPAPPKKDEPDAE